jgi:hypothetical protein
MNQDTGPQLSKLLDSARPEKVIAEAERIFSFWYPHKEFGIVLRSYELVRSLFSGGFPGYQACNTEYHNLNHTTDVLIAAARLLDGYALENAPLSPPLAQAVFVAALLHDTGYIMEIGDTPGTGAKYTTCHVSRGEDFARRNAERFDLDPEQADRIARLISCTELAKLPEDARFASSEGRIAGAILGSADILGQMADRAYLEKLLFLYYEFREAGFPGYHTEFDMLRKTVSFYSNARKRLDEDLSAFHELCRGHFRERFGIDRNLYIESIERQMDYLDTIIKDDSSNFRKKLKRIDLERVSEPVLETLKI